MRNIQINGDRLWETLMVSASIGTGPNGGLRRLTLTDDDKRMRDVFAGWAKAGGYPLTVDALGSMFIRREGTDANLPPVLVGSHLDTQAAGGRFDGILGVLAGLELLRTLDDLGVKTKRAIEVVNWTNEEGARFYPPMMASLAFSGGAEVGWVADREDKAGLKLGAELDRIGYRGDAKVGGRKIDSYFELHIEQGPRLDAEGVPVGVVVGGFATKGARIEISGATAHVGPTAMHRRQNALVGAAHVATVVDDIGWRYSSAEGKATAARLDLWPNLPGIISDRATLFVDMRHPDKVALDMMYAELEMSLPACHAKSRCAIEVGESWSFGGLTFDPELISLVRSAARDLGHATLDLRSEAGHDAYHMTKVCPTTMIFTPCKDGISHNEAEDMTLADAVPGANVLLRAVLARADR